MYLHTIIRCDPYLTLLQDFSEVMVVYNYHMLAIKLPN